MANFIILLKHLKITVLPRIIHMEKWENSGVGTQKNVTLYILNQLYLNKYVFHL